MDLCQGGILVDRDSPEALAQGVKDLISNPEHRMQLGQAARKRVEAHLSWREIARVTREGYLDVLAERRGFPTSTITSES